MQVRIISQLHKANRQVSLWFEEQLGQLDVSPVEGHLISYLGRYHPSPIAELIRVFGLKHSTMSSILDRLEKQGLLTRKVNPDDRRSFLVSPTKNGRRLAEKLAVIGDQLESELIAKLEPGELEGFRAVMEAIGQTTKVDVRGHDRAVKR